MQIYPAVLHNLRIVLLYVRVDTHRARWAIKSYLLRMISGLCSNSSTDPRLEEEEGANEVNYAEGGH